LGSGRPNGVICAWSDSMPTVRQRCAICVSLTILPDAKADGDGEVLILVTIDGAIENSLPETMRDTSSTCSMSCALALQFRSMTSMRCSP
jgi:hypothetical protein